MMRTAVALGSNLGDRFGNLRAARKAILGLSNVKPPILSSAIYETDPVDCEPGADKFLNAVIEFNYEGGPANLLEELIRIERSVRAASAIIQKMFREPSTSTCSIAATAR